MKNYIVTGVILVGFFAGVYFWETQMKAPASEQNNQTAAVQSTLQGKNPSVVMKTNFGDITLELFQKDAPKTVENFLKLVRAGFYNGTKFHRVIPNFMIQGGDPNTKDNNWADDGIGGPGYAFEDEKNNHTLVRGTLAMANSGPHTNGSQFFIVTAQSTPWLDGKHTVFGRVLEGMSAVTQIEQLTRDANDHPYQDAVISAIIVE